MQLKRNRGVAIVCLSSNQTSKRKSSSTSSSSPGLRERTSSLLRFAGGTNRVVDEAPRAPVPVALRVIGRREFEADVPGREATGTGLGSGARMAVDVAGRGGCDATLLVRTTEGALVIAGRDPVRVNVDFPFGFDVGTDLRGPKISSSSG